MKTETIAARIYKALVNTFPVCTSSDEFYYYPQVPAPFRHWADWDDFSPDAVQEVLHVLTDAMAELGRLSTTDIDPDTMIDISMLLRMARTLYEQLDKVAVHRSQPTFYLTIAAIGLSEALVSADPEAWPARANTLPKFLSQALDTLVRIPALFLELGLEMVDDLTAWLVSLDKSDKTVTPLLTGLTAFARGIQGLPVCKDFRLSLDLPPSIFKDQIGCGMEVNQIFEILALEIEGAERTLQKEAQLISPGGSWQEAYESISLPPLPADGLVGLYREAVADLSKHCQDQGLVSPQPLHSCPVKVTPLPSSLTAIRSAAAYSMPAGHPPAGGTFYVIDTGIPRETRNDLHREYRFLSAHETFPGHHLLDSTRWGLGRALRRPIEYPLFYEGWACFGEELLTKTGYFQGPADRLVLARRYLWRALRGKVDLALQTGKMDLFAAASFLAQAGMPEKRAASAVRKYALNPGYQLCYTIGLRNFRKLFEKYGKTDLKGFVRKVLAQGQIGFDDLERILEEHIGNI